ncbi:hypothetical protein [Alkalihalobacillus sp. TS-13]|uniref:hypothetical protein n=1 Tax=Alkalihalobacillus sp. TS-13 TaxID=2842455 RepID=UPI001C876E84|nr:hypothetical protein [Alkalihalobacillus sp. TS-13]
MSLENREKEIRAAIDAAVDAAMAALKEGGPSAAAVAIREKDLAAALSVAIGDDPTATAIATAINNVFEEYRLPIRTLTPPPPIQFP